MFLGNRAWSTALEEMLGPVVLGLTKMSVLGQKAMSEGLGQKTVTGPALHSPELDTFPNKIKQKPNHVNVNFIYEAL